MSSYLWIKLLHIVSATILFGTGLGTAFFMLRAYRSGSEEAFAATTRHVVSADWWFTTPAVVVQLVSGIWLTVQLGIAFDSAWFMTVMALYAFVGGCWLPVVWIQLRVRDMAGKGVPRQQLKTWMRAWIALGIPAFSAVLVLFFLMVSRQGAYT